MANWGDVVGSWQFIVDAVRYITMLIQLNIMVLLAGVFTYFAYQLFEIVGVVIVYASRSMIIAMYNQKQGRMLGTTVSEAELYSGVRRESALKVVWDVRSYLIRAYRVWQYSISYIMIGSFWLGLTLIFLNALTQGSVMSGDLTLMEYGSAILNNTGIIIRFAMAVIGFSVLVTILQIAWRIWRFGVMDTKLVGDKTIMQTISKELGDIIR